MSYCSYFRLPIISGSLFAGKFLGEELSHKLFSCSLISEHLYYTKSKTQVNIIMITILRCALEVTISLLVVQSAYRNALQPFLTAGHKNSKSAFHSCNTEIISALSSPVLLSENNLYKTVLPYNPLKSMDILSF